MIHYLKKVKCPICSSLDVKKELNNFFRCGSCALIFSQKKTKVNYGIKYYHREKKGLIKKVEEAYVYFSNLYKKLIIETNGDKQSLAESKLGKKKDIRILDIGSGRGAFLNVLGENYKKEGVELVNTKSTGVFDDIKMHYTSIDNLKVKKGGYDVITMWHVLEHLDNPRRSLGGIRKLLKEDGLLFISTPNTNSIGYKIAKEKWYHFDYPYHKNLFNKKALSVLTEKSGFRIKNFVGHPFEFPLDLFWSIVRSKKYLWLLAVYPLAKLLDEETLVCILKKK